MMNYVALLLKQTLSKAEDSVTTQNSSTYLKRILMKDVENVFEINI